MPFSPRLVTKPTHMAFAGDNVRYLPDCRSHLKKSKDKESASREIAAAEGDLRLLPCTPFLGVRAGGATTASCRRKMSPQMPREGGGKEMLREGALHEFPLPCRAAAI